MINEGDFCLVSHKKCYLKTILSKLQLYIKEELVVSALFYVELMKTPS